MAYSTNSTKWPYFNGKNWYKLVILFEAAKSTCWFVHLKLDNFDDEAHAIRVALSSCQKLGFLNGIVEDVVPPWTKDDWVTIRYMFVPWLRDTIYLEVCSILSNYDNAKRSRMTCMNNFRLLMVFVLTN